ncbi:hypothetical protein AVEN_251928-1 [Araneus ventricosus]|uniref:Uncharacterized protein n=1 Tax=Araneus ventricosus TaxID=182803 RepID=A0A4Y2GXB0_ARAVE|nr:hypothetical protein AVEN_251928-1 [Araneus ventricosus]
MESGKLLHFKNLKQYRYETNATIDTNYFSITLKNMKDGFAERLEQFKTNKSTLAFIVDSLNTNTNEINIEPFGIDAGSLQMQLLDLKTKDLWSGKFTELKSKLEELEVQKCMHIAQHKWPALKEIPQVEALIFGAWNSLPQCYSEDFNAESSVYNIDRGCLLNRVIWNRGSTFSSICDNYVTCVRTKYKSTALVILDGYPENETIGGTKCAERARITRKQMSSEAMLDESMIPTVYQEKVLANPKNKDRLISILMNKLSSLNMARRDAREIAAVGRPDCFVQCCVFIAGTTTITISSSN